MQLHAPAIEFGSPLHLLKIGYTGRRYELLAGFGVLSAVPGVGRFVVPAHFVTNFHSIPALATPILPPDDYAESAVAHDFLYEYGGVMGPDGQFYPITRHQADQVHRELLRLCGCPEWKVRAMYAALRIGGWKAWGDYRQRTPAVPLAVLMFA